MEDSTFPEMDLEAISILGSVMKQAGIELRNSPVTDGSCYVAMSATTVIRFLYKIILRHGYFEFQINNQWQKFVNEVNVELHKLKV